MKDAKIQWQRAWRWARTNGPEADLYGPGRLDPALVKFAVEMRAARVGRPRMTDRQFVIALRQGRCAERLAGVVVLPAPAPRAGTLTIGEFVKKCGEAMGAFENRSGAGVDPESGSRPPMAEVSLEPDQ
jgi:hypothetical protein